MRTNLEGRKGQTVVVVSVVPSSSHAPIQNVPPPPPNEQSLLRKLTFTTIPDKRTSPPNATNQSPPTLSNTLTPRVAPRSAFFFPLRLLIRHRTSRFIRRTARPHNSTLVLGPYTTDATHPVSLNSTPLGSPKRRYLPLLNQVKLGCRLLLSR